ncbi:MAG: hypothetical protein P4L85_13125 [Paludisphaera borealis]|uniref:hypothetical protein n=1 Tax=Paludisphaera borealis TaxID=1387353 RepID=UPI00284DBA9A|nr:hypothetical protein [Paludisphaera borealis]MDR3620286.1 hypothetical protein [Paludisphaera borealis]
MPTVSTLKLVCESKLCDLLPCDPPAKRWEASGVLVKDRHYFVVFDDRTEIARVSDDLQPHSTNGLFGMAHEVCGYEGITYNTAKRRYYLLVEAHRQESGHYRALIVEYDDAFQFLKDRPVDFIFKSSNKGFEAVAHVRRDNIDYILALCEGNECQGGDKGRKPGGGRVQLFEKRKQQWSHSRTIALPDTLPFVDYSGMSINDGCVAIVSQVNSMLWVGRFNEAGWTWHDEGQLYAFPKSDDGDIQYGNIEGVAWITPTRIVTVSDRRKKKQQPKAHSDKDQSIHIFDIPQ